MTQQPQNTAAPPPCQDGRRCSDQDRYVTDAGSEADGPLHAFTCLHHPHMGASRAARIDSMTVAELRHALTFLTGWTPTGVDEAIASATAAGTPAVTS